MSETPDLFSEENIKRMVHREPHTTEVDAARFIITKMNAIQTEYMAAFKEHGPMTDGELEQLPRFQGYGPSTVRKRRSELFQAGYLVEAGERKNDRGRPMKVWKINENAQ